MAHPALAFNQALAGEKLERGRGYDQRDLDSSWNVPAKRRMQLRARATFYRLLAGAFHRRAWDRLSGGLARTGGHRRSGEPWHARFDADFTDADLGELEETLACEYTTLFTSPGGCPPVESARLTGRLQQEPFHAVQSFYRRCGFELENGRFALVRGSAWALS